MGYRIEKAYYDTDLLIPENNIPTNRDSRANTSNIIDYLIPTSAT